MSYATPIERIYTVPADARTNPVAADSRVYAVPNNEQCPPHNAATASATECYASDTNVSQQVDVSDAHAVETPYDQMKPGTQGMTTTTDTTVLNTNTASGTHNPQQGLA